MATEAHRGDRVAGGVGGVRRLTGGVEDDPPVAAPHHHGHGDDDADGDVHDSVLGEQRLADEGDVGEHRDLHVGGPRRPRRAGAPAVDLAIEERREGDAEQREPEPGDDLVDA